MRTLVLLLVLLNVCFLFWAQYIDVSEPVAMTLDVPAETTARRLQLASERTRSSLIEHSNTALLSCISIGPFPQMNDVNAVQQRLQQAGFTTTLRTERGDIFAGYWVSLPPFSSRIEAEAALAKLHTSGVGDAYLMADDTTASANVISLGLFSEQANAQRRRDEVAKLGFEATIQPRTRSGEQGWLDVQLKQPGQDIDPSLLQPQVGAILRLETKPCPASTAEGATPNASSSSKSAANSATGSEKEG
ncbi:MAG TPA: SPOR domain-containing protein [Steroidobacteraceae bacterium]|nr:SPOR domain-containing protein [Steroidobacteraceae bacterium]